MKNENAISNTIIIFITITFWSIIIIHFVVIPDFCSGILQLGKLAIKS